MNGISHPVDESLQLGGHSMKVVGRAQYQTVRHKDLLIKPLKVVFMHALAGFKAGLTGIAVLDIKLAQVDQLSLCPVLSCTL